MDCLQTSPPASHQAPNQSDPGERRGAAVMVVAGAGPVGLTAAYELARRGVTVRVIDKLTVPTDQSRTITIHARSLKMSVTWA